jgi:glycosyltransferase involved in cell wall biosynthesis
MRMPVISTSVGCAGLRCEHGRNILIADNPQQFADQIYSLVKDPSRRQNLAEAGRKTAEEHYGWDKSAQQLEALYAHYLKPGTVH